MYAIRSYYEDGKPFQTVYPIADRDMVTILRDAGVDITVKETQKDSWLMTSYNFV